MTRLGSMQEYFVHKSNDFKGEIKLLILEFHEQKNLKKLYIALR